MNTWILIFVVFALVYWSVSSTTGDNARRRRLRAEADQLITRAQLAAAGESDWMFTKALRMARDAGDGLLCSEAAYGLANLQMKRGQYSEAAKLLVVALDCKGNPGWPEEKPNYEALLRTCLKEANAKATAPKTGK